MDYRVTAVHPQKDKNSNKSWKINPKEQLSSYLFNFASIVFTFQSNFAFILSILYACISLTKTLQKLNQMHLNFAKEFFSRYVRNATLNKLQNFLHEKKLWPSFRYLEFYAHSDVKLRTVLDLA